MMDRMERPDELQALIERELDDPASVSGFFKPAAACVLRKGPAAALATRFGGLPTLARDRWPERGGALLPFICQFDLGEVSRYLDPSDGWPAAGLLSFFAEPEGNFPEYSIVYAPHPAAAGPPPDGSYEGVVVLPEHSIKVSGIWSMCDESVRYLNVLRGEQIRRYQQLRSTLFRPDGWAGDMLGGYPISPYEDALFGLAESMVKRYAGVRVEDVRLLLQLRPRAGLGLEYGDEQITYAAATRRSITDASFDESEFLTEQS